MSIASKDARETKYWLRLLNKRNYLDEYRNKSVLFNSIQSIVKLLASIIENQGKELKVQNQQFILLNGSPNLV